MAEKARHAYGQSSGVLAALQAGTINAYDILFLDGDTEPKVGWVDKNGNYRLVDTEKIIIVEGDTLPETGVVGKIYIFGEEGYFYNGTEFKPLAKSADLTTLENQVANLETQMSSKVDEATIDSKIETAVETAVAEATGGEVIEF